MVSFSTASFISLALIFCSFANSIIRIIVGDAVIDLLNSPTAILTPMHIFMLLGTTEIMLPSSSSINPGPSFFPTDTVQKAPLSKNTTGWRFFFALINVHAGLFLAGQMNAIISQTIRTENVAIGPPINRAMWKNDSSTITISSLPFSLDDPSLDSGLLSSDVVIDDPLILLIVSERNLPSLYTS